jgi:hypothetical protein
LRREGSETTTSRHEQVYAERRADPQGFCVEAAKEIDWIRPRASSSSPCSLFLNQLGPRLPARLELEDSIMSVSAIVSVGGQAATPSAAATAPAASADPAHAAAAAKGAHHGHGHKPAASSPAASASSAALAVLSKLQIGG